MDSAKGPHKKRWLEKQFLFNLTQFEELMEVSYPDTKRYIRDPVAYYQRVTGECNYLAAVESIDWGRYIGENGSILDLGGGSGWLSGFLSRYEQVKTIYLLDSSTFFLEKMMPVSVELAGGDMGKISVIEGLFTPLYFDDEELDLVVASSAIHHASHLGGVLGEIARVLKQGGHLLILNETPHPNGAYLRAIARAMLKIMRDALWRRYVPISPAVSSCGYLYDPHLADMTYPLWYWRESIRSAGLKLVDLIDTGLPTVKNSKGASLKHFICRR